MCFCRQVNRLQQQNHVNGGGHNRQTRKPISHVNRPPVQPAYRPATLPVSPKKL